MALTFESAAEKIKEIQNVSDDNKLKLYGLYKQATVGDINIAQPWAIQIEARAKWGAWNEQKGKSSDQAKQDYVELCQSLGVQ